MTQKQSSLVVTPKEGNITVKVSGINDVMGTVVFRADAGRDSCELTFSAPGLARLQPGTYTGAVASVMPYSKTPGLRVSCCFDCGDDRHPGTFTINEIVYGRGTAVLKFDATFELRANDGKHHCAGRVHFQ